MNARRLSIPVDMQRQYESYMASVEWKQRRQRAIELAGYCCERCGATAWDKRLEVHHLTYERMGHEKDADLMALCPECHAAADRERAISGLYKSQQALWLKRLNGWATKKYGEDWGFYYDEDVIAQEFEAWLERRGEA